MYSFCSKILQRLSYSCQSIGSFRDDKSMFQIKEAVLTTKATLVALYKTLSNAIASSNDYEVVCQRLCASGELQKIQIHQ